MDQTKTWIRKKRQFLTKLRKSKKIVPSLVLPAAKNGFDIWNQREKLHQDHNRASWKLKVRALCISLMYVVHVTATWRDRGRNRMKLTWQAMAETWQAMAETRHQPGRGCGWCQWGYRVTGATGGRHDRHTVPWRSDTWGYRATSTDTVAVTVTVLESQSVHSSLALMPRLSPHQSRSLPIRRHSH